MNVTKVPSLLLAATLAQAHASFAQGSPLTIQGDNYPSICVSSERAKLEQQVVEAASGKQVDGLMSLVFTILCGKGPKADETVRRASVTPMQLSSISTDDKEATLKQISRSELKAYAGAAWDPTVNMSDEGLKLHFFKSEACN